jgi:REP element-mobilizing transposase RayT
MWWHRLEEKFEQVGIDEFVIMPDHLHGIILIHEHGNTLPATSLGCVVQWFKTMTTNAYIRGVREEDRLPFSSRLWQRGYYDRVIRNEQDLDRIRRYINDNPDQLLGLE